MRKTFFLLALCGALAAAGPAHAQSRGYKLVVNKANPVSSLSREKAARIFMKQVEKWEHGAAVDPVDQAPGAAVRQRFSEEIHRRDVAAVQSAWQRAIFSGRGVPPPEKDGDEAVIGYVADHAGGIGYVSEQASTDKVKVIDLAR